KAADGIRSRNVTGVETCALAIYIGGHPPRETDGENIRVQRRVRPAQFGRRGPTLQPRLAGARPRLLHEPFPPGPQQLPQGGVVEDRNSVVEDKRLRPGVPRLTAV